MLEPAITPLLSPSFFYFPKINRLQKLKYTAGLHQQVCFHCLVCGACSSGVSVGIVYFGDNWEPNELYSQS